MRMPRGICIDNRRKVIYKTLWEDVIENIKKLCGEMEVEIIEGRRAPTTFIF